VYGVRQSTAICGLADARRHREEQRHADQDRTLLAMQQLEAALGSAAPHREEA
jgi:hypothetical protein